MNHSNARLSIHFLFLRRINIIDAFFTNSLVSQTNTSPLFAIQHIFSSFIPIVFIDSASYMQILSAFLVLYRAEKLVSVRCLHLSVTKTWRMKNYEGLGGECVCWGHNGEIWAKSIYCAKCDCFIIGKVDFLCRSDSIAP